MSDERALQRAGHANGAAFIAQIDSRGNNGWKLKNVEGDIVKGATSPGNADWEQGTWVTVLQLHGGSLMILGRAPNGPTNNQ